MEHAIIFGITGQDGSHLADYCWKRVHNKLLDL